MSSKWTDAAEIFFSVAQSKLFEQVIMKRFPLNIRHSRALLAGFGALAFAAAIQTSFAISNDDRAADESITNVAKNLARMNYGTQIEWTAPDGRTADVATATPDNKSATALIMDDETLSCPLQEGQTTFVIKLPTTAQLDRFTFVNENAAAAGNLKISVSNYKLPATSPKWVDVDGNISFTRKRLFNLSMLGVEARYVKLSFNVDKAGPHRQPRPLWRRNARAIRAAPAPNLRPDGMALEQRQRTRQRHRRSAQLQLREPLREGTGRSRQLRRRAGLRSA